MKRKVTAILLLSFIIILSPIEAKRNIDQLQLQTIPDEAIRLRILANSDSDADQKLKYIVRDKVNEEISKWVANVDQIEEARGIIETNIDKVEMIVKSVLKDEGSDQSVNVEYNSNITFPMKVYDNYVYPPGEYEAVLITLGEGMGANWWCVLFPPLCFLDFSNGATIAEANDDEEDDGEEEEVKVKFFLFDLFSSS